MAALQQVTICPPAPAHQILQEEPQWGAFRKLPVGVEFGRGEIRSTGLDFSDYCRAQTRSHCVSGRRTPCPAWALNAEMLALVIARHFERRAGFRKPTPGAPLERLQRAQTALLAALPRKEQILEGLCREYVALKKVRPGPAIRERLKKLEEIIENQDSQIRFTKEFPAKTAAIVYFYFRCGFDSVETANAVGIKPPHVRRTIWALCRAAKLLEKEKHIQPVIPARLCRVARVARCYRKMRACKTCNAAIVARTNRQYCTDCKPRAHSPMLKTRICRGCGSRFLAKRFLYCADCKEARKPKPETRDEKIILAVQMWQHGARLGQIACALGYPMGHGNNFVRRVLISAGVYRGR